MKFPTVASAFCLGSAKGRSGRPRSGGGGVPADGSWLRRWQTPPVAANLLFNF